MAAPIVLELQFKATDDATRTLTTAMQQNTAMAKDFGKALGDALSFNNKAALDRIKEINDAMGTLVTKSQRVSTDVYANLTEGFNLAARDIKSTIANINAEIDKLATKTAALKNQPGQPTGTNAPKPATPPAATPPPSAAPPPAPTAPPSTPRTAPTGNTAVPNATAAAQSTAATRQMMSNMELIALGAKNNAEKAQQAFMNRFGANFFANLAAEGIETFFNKMDSLFRQTVLYAARTEELGVALDSLAKVNRISTETIENQEVAIKRLNITTQDTRETIARFINVGFDLNKAGPLARVAQDLAVIGNKSTSEELNALVIAIQTLQSRNLRSAGVFLTIDEILDNLAASSGRARDSFSTLEKQQAVLNAVLEYGGKVAGTYEASMSTASKQIRSMERLTMEAQNAIGERFVPALATAVTVVSELLKWIARFPDTTIAIVRNVGLLSAALIVLNTSIVSGTISAFLNMIAIGGNMIGVTFGQTAAIKTQSATLLENARLELLVAEAKQRTTLRRIAASRTIDAETAATMREVAAKRVELAQAGVAGATVTKAGASAAGVLGTVGLVIAAISALVGIYDFFKEKASQPMEIKSLDVNAAKKYREDEEKLSARRSELEQLYQANLNSTRDIRTKELEISKLLTVEGEKQFAIASETGEQREKNMRVLDEELKRQRGNIKAQQDLSVANVDAAFKNAAAVEKQVDNAVKVFETSKRAREIVGEDSWSQKGLRAMLSYVPLLNRFERPNPETTQGNLNQVPAGVKGRDAEFFETNSSLKGQLFDAAAYYEKSLEDLNALNEKSKEAKATIASTIDDLNKLAAAYGVSSDVLIKGFFGENTEAAEDLKKKIKDVQAAALQSAAVVSTAMDDLADKGITNVAEQYLTKLTEIEIKTRAVLQARNDAARAATGNILFSPEQIDQQVANARERFRSGFIGGQLFDELKKATDTLLVEEARKREQELQRPLTRTEAQGLRTEFFEKNKDKLVDIKNAAGEVIYDKDGKPMQAKVEELFQVFEKSRDFERIQRLLKQNADDVKSVGDAYDEAKAKLDAFFNESAGDRETRFKTEDVQNQLRDVERLARLDYRLTGKANADYQKFKDDPKGLQAEIKSREMSVKIQEAEFEMNDKTALAQAAKLRHVEKEKSLRQQIITAQEEVDYQKEFADLIRQAEALERQKRIRDEIHKLQNAQLDAEAELESARQALNVAVVSSETRAHTMILKNIRERRDAEAQLTADISAEIDKRARYRVDSEENVNRVVANTFLERMRGERSAQEEVIAAFTNLQLSQGNTQSLANNPLIASADRTADQLEGLSEQTDIQLLTHQRTNELLENNIQNAIIASADKTETVRSQVETLSTESKANTDRMIDAIQNISLNAGGSTSSYGMVGSLQGLAPDEIVGRIRNAILGQESGGKYYAVNPHSGALGYGQVMPGNVASWTAEAGLGRMTGQQFLNNPQAQLQTINHKLRQYFDQELRAAGGNPDVAAMRVAAKWYSGQGSNYTSTKPQFYKGNPYPSINEYSTQVFNRATKGQGGVSDRSAVNLTIERRRIDAEEARKMDADKKRLEADLKKAEAKKEDVAPIKRQLELLEEKRKAQQITVKEELQRFLQEATNSNLQLSQFSEAQAKAATSVINALNGTENLQKNLESAMRANKAFELRVREAQDIQDEYDRRVSDRKNFGANRQRANYGVELQELIALQTPGSEAQDEQTRNVRIERLKEQQELQRTAIKLTEEERFREQDASTYLSKLYKSLDNERRQSALNLQDELARLNEQEMYRAENRREYLLQIENEVTVARRKTYQDAQRDSDASMEESRQFDANRADEALKIWREVETARRRATTETERELMRAQTEGQQFFANMTQERENLWRTMETERQRASVEVQRSIMRLEAELASGNEGMTDRLREKWLQLQVERSKGDENAMLSQLESLSKIEDASVRSIEKIRAKVYEHVASVQTVNDEIADLFTGTFDAIGSLFDKSVDRVTEKLGVFGDVIGNFMKGISRRFLAQAEKSIFDAIFGPANPDVQNAQNVDLTQAKQAEANASINVSTNLDLLSQAALAAAQNLTSIGQGGLGFGFGTDNKAQEIAERTATQIDELMNLSLGLPSNTERAEEDISAAMQQLSSGAASSAGAMIINAQAATVAAQSTINVASTLGGFGQIVGRLGSGIAGVVGFIGSIINAFRGGGGGASGGGIVGTAGSIISGGFSGGTIRMGGGAPTIGMGGGGSANSTFRQIMSRGGNPFDVDFTKMASATDAATRSGVSAAGQTAGTGAAGGAAAGGFNWAGVKSGIANLAPGIGMSLGGMLGGPSAVGGILGSAGGLLAGTLGGALLTAGSLGAAGSTGAIGSIAGFLGLSGAATMGIGFAIAGGLMLVSWLFGRSAKKKADKKAVDKVKSEALSQLQDLLKAVRSDRVDGAEAIARAAEIRKQFVDSAAQLKTKDGRKAHTAALGDIDRIIAEISAASVAQEQRKEINEKLVPTYATGGIASMETIRVSRGETLYHPAVASQMADAFAGAGVPGFADGGQTRRSSFGQFMMNAIMSDSPVRAGGPWAAMAEKLRRRRIAAQSAGRFTIPGVFDRRDDILVNVPRGTVITTPQQERDIQSYRGYNTGGQVSDRRGYAARGVSGTVAPGNVAAPTRVESATSQPTVVIVVANEEMADTIMSQTPNATIANKTIAHVKETGTSGLAGVIGKTLGS